MHRAASIAIEILLGTGSGKQRRLINISEIARDKGPDYCTTLLGICVFTGEDATSALKGKGKIDPFKKLNIYPIYCSVFKRFGEEWSVSNDICSKIETFTCLMFGCTREKRINVVRAKILRKIVGEYNQQTIKSKIENTIEDILNHTYILGVGCSAQFCSYNQRSYLFFRVATCKRVSEPIYWIPKPWEENQGWVKNDNGVLELAWSLRTVLSQSLMNILETTADDLEERNEENTTDKDEEMDFEEMFEEDVDI